MRKLKVVQLVLSLGVLLYVTALYAAEETFTITTYYPSPYGSYNELSANKVKVGDVAMPTSNGILGIGTGIIYNPQVGDPAAWLVGVPGSLVYSSDNSAFYYSDGVDWQALGGGGGGSKVVKVSGKVSGMLGLMKIDCGAGYQITRCGVGVFDDAATWYKAYAENNAVVAFMGAEASSPSGFSSAGAHNCEATAFGAQSYQIQGNPSMYTAIMVECAKQ